MIFLSSSRYRLRHYLTLPRPFLFNYVEVYIYGLRRHYTYLILCNESFDMLIATFQSIRVFSVTQCHLESGFRRFEKKVRSFQTSEKNN